MAAVLSTGQLYGIGLEQFHPDTRTRLEAWLRRMADCGNEVSLRSCPDGHATRTVVECCRVPACPWEEVRTSMEWKLRGVALMEQLPDGLRYSQVLAKMRRLDIELAMKEPPPAGAMMRWKMLTVSLRQAEDLLTDIRQTMAVRARLARHLRNYRGAVAQVWALDVGPDGHAHLHALLYCPFLSRDAVQHWVQSQDCTVPGCKHKAGDRSCGGSWVVDVRKAWSPDEVLKYSVSPAAKGHDREDHAQLRLAVYLATYGKHRVQAYGLAEKAQLRVVDSRVEDVLVHGCCPVCGQEMMEIAAGHWDHGRYEWRPRC